MAGYSGTPLVKKLGIKARHRVALVAAPPGFTLPTDELPPGVVLESDPGDKVVWDIILFFTDNLADLRKRFAALAGRLDEAGGLWVAWPKRASGVATDLTEDVVRAVGLEAGLVDNKVCAVDATWSGLRFVIRVKDRPGKKIHRARAGRSD
jgi:hypothetical protein